MCETRLRILALIVSVSMLWMSCGQDKNTGTSNSVTKVREQARSSSTRFATALPATPAIQPLRPGRPQRPSSIAATQYVLVAWAELGMHCMDGKDYSVFGVLPPYNTVKAQLIAPGNPPQIVTTGVTITYEAMVDTGGSINTSSSTKTNFWTYVSKLFNAVVPPEQGLTGNGTQSLSPHSLQWNSIDGLWEAVGIPTIPYDDQGVSNAYPMAKLVARDNTGAILATSTVVLAVSDEMTCSVCHASGTNDAAKPASGWENNADPAKDIKLNILRKHDDRFNVTTQVAALAGAGYNYQASLYQTAISGTPILCATCHASNALGTAGVPGAHPLTTDMHTLHGPVVLPSSGKPLDQATTPYDSCYLCHPGTNTKCQRGAMHKTACYDCHGNLTDVGSSARRGWLDLPNCQMCHNNGQRYGTTFQSPGVWRTTNDTRFATNPNTPLTNTALYRFSLGHGNVTCAACHGSPHAEYPTLKANDNVYSTLLQGHDGKLAECKVCHTGFTNITNGGPHGMHIVGQAWVSQHGDIAGGNTTACAVCHGSDFKGSFLSATSMARSFTTEWGPISYTSKQNVSCYDCHFGPNGG